MRPADRLSIIVIGDEEKLKKGAAKIVGFSSRSIKSIKANSEAGTEHLKDKTYLPFCFKM